MKGFGGERSLFISEILKQVTYQFGEGFRLRAQKNISGSLGNGPVDYAIKHNNAIVVITEAKEENIDQGVAQNINQLDSAGKQSICCQSIAPQEVNRKRKRQPAPQDPQAPQAQAPQAPQDPQDPRCPQKLYGIFTTGREWVFLRLEGQTVEVHEEAPLQLPAYAINTEKTKSLLREDIKALFLGIYQLITESLPKKPRLMGSS